MVRLRISRSALSSSAVLAIRIVGALMQMSLVAILVWRYSPYEVGLNGVLWSVALVARMTGAAGLETLGFKLQAPLWAVNDGAAARSLALRDLRLVLIGWSGLLGLVGLGALVGTMAFEWPGWWIVALGVVAATSGFHRLFVLQLQAKEKPVLGQFMESVALPGLASIGALTAASLAPEHLITTQVMAFIVVAAVLYIVSPCFRCQERASNEPVVWHTALVLAVSAFLTALTSRAPVFFLGAHSLAAAGVYDVAQKIQSAGALGTDAVATVYMSRISVALRRAKDLLRIMYETAVLSLLIPMGVLALLFLLGRDGVASLLGPEYSDAWLAAVLLVVASIVNAITSAMSNVIILGDRERMYLGVCVVQISLVIGGALLSGAGTAVEIAVWVLVGQIFRSGATVAGFVLHCQALPAHVAEQTALRL